MDVTLGHFFASSRSDAVVTRRQPFPPKPSVKPSLIFFGPHHDGVADVSLDDVDFADDVAATTIIAPQASASARTTPPRFLLMYPSSLPVLVACSVGTTMCRLVAVGDSCRCDRARAMCGHASRQRPPVDRVEGDAHGQRSGLHKRATGVANPERQDELVEL